MDCNFHSGDMLGNLTLEIFGQKEDSTGQSVILRTSSHDAVDWSESLDKSLGLNSSMKACEKNKSEVADINSIFFKTIKIKLLLFSKLNAIQRKHIGRYKWAEHYFQHCPNDKVPLKNKSNYIKYQGLEPESEYRHMYPAELVLLEMINKQKHIIQVKLPLLYQQGLYNCQHILYCFLQN